MKYLLIILCIVCIILSLQNYRYTQFIDKIFTIHTGMTVEQVKDIMGQPKLDTSLIMIWWFKPYIIMGKILKIDIKVHNRKVINIKYSYLPQ